MIKHFVPLSTRHPINCFASIEPWQAVCAIDENTRISIQQHFMVSRGLLAEDSILTLCVSCFRRGFRIRHHEMRPGRVCSIHQTNHQISYY